MWKGVNLRTSMERFGGIFYDVADQRAATSRNTLGRVIKRPRGLLFYRGPRFKGDSILRTGKAIRIQTAV